MSTLAAEVANQTIDEPKFKIEFPMSPRDVLMHLSKYLLDYEKKEILEYETIYYLNLL